MGLQIPAALEPVAAVVVYRWPKADETKLFSLGNKAEAMANTLEKYSGKIDTKFQEALGHIEGETHDAIERYRQKTMQAVETLTDLLRDIALALRIYASLILAIKLYIISMLIYTAIQLAAAAAAAVPTLGASTAEAAAMQVAIRTAITQALRKLIQQILTQTVIKAATGALTSTAMEFLRQTIGIEMGTRDGYDVDRLVESGERGALDGAIQGALNKLGFNSTDTKKLAEQLTTTVFGPARNYKALHDGSQQTDTSDTTTTQHAPYVSTSPGGTTFTAGTSGDDSSTPQHAPYVSSSPGGTTFTAGTSTDDSSPQHSPYVAPSTTPTPTSIHDTTVPTSTHGPYTTSTSPVSPPEPTTDPPPKEPGQDELTPTSTSPSSLDMGAGDTFHIDVRTGSSLDL
ncbi:hypothetical protein ACQPZ2_03440 [Nocardia pseudovaccinii]|uniref:WXG100-like domain-containing protein n=1 Tax=Nocardia pseudovaccinii TaxID=189540 RepID=UPI003D8B51D5